MVTYFLLALGAHPHGPAGSFERGVQAVGVVRSGAGVTRLKISIFFTHRAVIIMLQLLLCVTQPSKIDVTPVIYKVIDTTSTTQHPDAN